MCELLMKDAIFIYQLVKLFPNLRTLVYLDTLGTKRKRQRKRGGRKGERKNVFLIKIGWCYVALIFNFQTFSSNYVVYLFSPKLSSLGVHCGMSFFLENTKEKLYLFTFPSKIVNAYYLYTFYKRKRCNL